jgi:hypothetical protein
VADHSKENALSNKAGIWIDHRRAVIVLVGAQERTLVIDSHVEKHPERSGDSPMKGSYEARQVPADDKRQRALTGELNGYYDSVIAAVHEAGALFIFGPGEAKGELEKRLQGNKSGARVQAIETADRMTDRQIQAKVHEFFASSSAR